MDLSQEIIMEENNNVKKIVKKVIQEEVGMMIKNKMYEIQKETGKPLIDTLINKLINKALSKDIDAKSYLEYFNNIAEYMGMGKPKYNLPQLSNQPNINIQNNIISNEDKNKIQNLIAESIIKNRNNNNNNINGENGTNI